jgi:hypothetical protein
MQMHADLLGQMQLVHARPKDEKRGANQVDQVLRRDAKAELR